MREHAITYLPWLLSVITIYMTILAGNKHPAAWAIGLANQALWLAWIVASSAYGLLPMNLALWVVYARNHWKWQDQDRIGTEFKIVSGPDHDAIRMACPDCAGSVLWAGKYNKCYDCGKGIY